MKSWKLKIYVVLLFLLVIGGIFTWTKKEALADMIVNAWMGYRLTSGLVGYWTFDGKDTNWGTNTTNDVSGQGNTGTLTSMSTTTSPVVGKLGQGLKFDGTSNYSTIPSVDQYKFSSAYSISFWIKPTATAANRIMTMGDGALFRWMFQTDASNHMGFAHSSPGSWAAMTTSYTTATAPSGQWTLITLTRAGAKSTTANLYVNGVFDSSFTDDHYDTSAIAIDVARGYISGAYTYFAGVLDDTRFYNRALSADEVQRLYLMGGSHVQNISPRNRLTSGLVGYWTFDGKDMTPNVRDVSGQGNHGGLQNQNPTTTAIGKIGQGLKFDGSNDYVSVADANSLDLTNNLTISLWFKPTVLTQTSRYLLSKLNTAGTDNAYAVLWEYSNNKVQFYSQGSPVGYSAANTDITVNDTQWHHITYTYDGTTFKGYLDGVSAITPVTVGFSLTAGTGILILDDLNGSGAFASNATLDDVRIYNRALSADEVQQLYLMGGSHVQNISPRNRLTSGLVGYWTFDGKDMGPNVRDVSGQGNHGGLQNQNPTTTAIGKLGQGLSFDGSDDYVSTALTSGKTFTWSVWFKSSSVTTACGFQNIVSIPLPNYMLMIVCSSAGSFWSRDGMAGGTLSVTGLANNTWYHLVLVREADSTTGGYKAYLNGVFKGQANTGTWSSADVIRIGNRSDAAQPFNGALDDVRIYNRVLSVDEVRALYQLGR